MSSTKLWSFQLSNFSELIAIIKRIAKGEAVQTDISNVISTLTNLGVEADDIQKFTSILNADRQQVYQIVFQLGKYNSNIGQAKGNQFDIHDGISSEEIKEVLREVLQEFFSNTSIGISAKNLPAVDYEITERRERTNSEISQYLPTSELPAISTFDFETITVGKQGNITRRSIKQAEYFVEYLNNGVELEMVSIPGGSFTMGASKDESGTIEDERPQHLVTLKPFFLGKYPITQAQWQEVANFPKIKYELESEPSYFKGDNLPVECISWYEAQEFCARLSQKTGRVYRLPSEAEWEYACRANTTSSFYCGAIITRDLANYGEEQQTHFRVSQTSEVGIFPANSFGLYDMHGNVWEWCADYQHEDYQDAPSDGSVWIIDGNPEYRMLRGGAWDYDFSYCRSASRYFENPSTRNESFGFRVVCCLDNA
ncbi:formylglycine-generating enzyme family protein [Trichormus variabilis ARAD]|uniref:Formylglycine-generating enzyme family protein n=1 Tax=Trichormus variabilis N2B TaxID=2681315 RepID=A0ABR6S843_ANAVA|nr:formylglycine-generating enzyme family protein [Trichormus variabilis ARAD]MBC1266360.1 formylglycine-generating enzyme family protein [Trichormus variabilis FSR]MBC1302571.1 formylglycine-generating enzyme family protein [Trichormus variabilis N2B]MBC1311150.1 formylglycine-generating enzyme family protein [Trichormus variabilis PNB]MBC1326608.1 formylglycine-generating enzyme family protein [Trichormus variabilis 9RC]MBD2380808.1 formylglycine-generating enzyme family protein [Trichormus 